MNNNSILIREEYGWKLYQEAGVKLWFCGYLSEERTVYDILRYFISISKKDDIEIEELSQWIERLVGHFALVVKVIDAWCFSAVDKVCSIPLYERSNECEYIVTNYAPYISKHNSNINLRALLEISMSGYTIGKKTIYSDIDRFSASECSLWINGNLHRKYYYSYLPYISQNNETKELQDELTRTILSVLQRMIMSVSGRQIVVPLSAGNDSRLIASGLNKLNYKNVVCFSYGRKGNYEVKTGEKIANKLGYKWVYVEDNYRNKRLFFKSNVYRQYIKEFESYASVPNVQDVYEVYKLSLMKVIDENAVIVNGNTGDFISGGHIPFNIDSCRKKSALNNINWSPFLDKHYSVWRVLRSKENDPIIKSELCEFAKSREIIEKNKEIYDYSIFECMEFLGRQSRFVLNQQRAYEFIGHEWRLPLWDSELLNYWEKIPVEYKIKQRLYKETLMKNDWGGVWKDIRVNNKLIRPYTLLFIRLFVKVIASPFGKKKWHSLEKNIFVYWMHPSYSRAVESYLKVLFDRRGQRNTISWLSDQFVKRNGFKGVRDISKKMKSNMQ